MSEFQIPNSKFRMVRRLNGVPASDRAAAFAKASASLAGPEKRSGGSGAEPGLDRYGSARDSGLCSRCRITAGAHGAPGAGSGAGRRGPRKRPSRGPGQSPGLSLCYPAVTLDFKPS